MKDKHGTWMGPGYYRKDYGNDLSYPATVYWIDSNYDADGKGLWVNGTDIHPWEPVKVIKRPKAKA